MAQQQYESLGGEELLESLQKDAAIQGVSDIHFAPEKDFVRLEWRLHGVLQNLCSVKPLAYEAVIRRIKFLSKMKLNITTIPQDGQYSFITESRDVNVRVATLPAHFGEKLTLRLLDPKRGIIDLERLGFPESIRTQLNALVGNPHGIVLVTGPTGSGKTTTLYSLLSSIVGKERNIITLEDPVEYELKGIVQSQVDPDHDYTFATGLRSILRHDPDVILIGEIRDLETAQTAVDAALTGHLVLSTLHTNSSVEAIPRLLSMGVSPYTFAPALRGILAQRMVRTLTEECKKEGAHCDPGSHESYSGVTVVPELLMATPKIQEMILLSEQENVILEEARKDGFRPMKEWGEELVKNRITLKEEVERVTM